MKNPEYDKIISKLLTRIYDEEKLNCAMAPHRAETLLCDLKRAIYNIYCTENRYGLQQADTHCRKGTERG